MLSRLRRAAAKKRPPSHPPLRFELLEDRAVPDATYHNLASGDFVQNWSDTGLITADDNWGGVPSIIGYRGDDLTTATATDPQTILADGTGTPVDVNANRSDPNTFTTGGITEFDGIPNPVVALQGSGTADAPFLLIHLNSTGRENVTISYKLRDIDGSADNAVQPFAVHYRVGNTGNFINLTTGFVSDATTGPNQATQETTVTAVLPAEASNQAQLQIRIMTTNAAGSDEWVGVDDILVASSAISGGNQNPTITLPGGAVNYTENDAATVLDGGATVADPDSANFDTGALTVDFSANGTDDDRLAIRNEGTGTGQIGVSGSDVTFGGTTIGTFTGGTGTTALVVTFNANATPAAVEALVRNITFANVSENPSTTARTVRFVVTDGDGGTSAAATKTVNVAAVNDAPVVTTSAGSTGFTENGSPTAIDANLTVSDADSPNLTGATVQITGNYASGQDVLAFTDGNGITGTWNPTDGILTLSGTASVATYQTALRTVTYVNTSDNPSTSNRTVTFVVNDGTAPSAGATKTVTVTAVNDAPAGTDKTVTLNEDTTYTFTTADFGFGDVDGHALLAVRVATVPALGTLAFNGTAVNAGDFVPAADIAAGKLTYTPALNGAGAGYASFTFQVQDGGGTANGGADLDPTANTVTFNVTLVNDPPVITLPGAPATFTENGGPVVIDGAATVTDVDNGNFDSGTLTVDITANGTADDRLSVRDEGTGVGQIGFNGTEVRYNSGSGSVIIGFLTSSGVGTTPLAIMFNGAANIEAVQALARNITFGNVSENPSAAARTVRFVVTDDFDAANNTSAPVTQTVNVVAVNDAPTVTASAGSTGYTEGNAPTAIDASLLVSDVDSPNLTGATVQITGNYASGQDVLGFTDGNGITGTWNPADGTLTLTGTASVSAYQTALRSVTYTNTSGNPSTADRTITFVVNDGAAPSAPATKTVTVAAVDQSPVVTTSPGSTPFVENGSPVAIDANLTVTDGDSPNLPSATVAITGNYASGQDVLAFVDGNGITGTWNPADGTLALTGTASVAAYQAALRSVTYVNTSDDPSAADRTIVFLVNDGNSASSLAGKTVTVAAVNDAPALAATGGTPTFTENGTAGALFSGAAVATVEAGQNINQITLAVTNVTDGASELLVVDGTAVALTDGNSVTTGANGFTVTVALAGTTATVIVGKAGGISPAVAADTVNGLAYRNTSENPTAANRVATLTSVRDTGGTDNGGVDLTALSIAATVTVVAVNDAPVLAGANDLAAIDEDPTANPGTLVSALVAGQITDPDNTFRGIAITATPTASGSWEYTTNGGTNWQPVGFVLDGAALLLAADANTLVRFVPAADFNGTVTNGLTFRTWDGTSGSAEARVDVSLNGGSTAFSAETAASSVTVNPVNDEPSITFASATITVNEDSGSFTQAGFATLVPGGGSDENGQTALSYSVSGNNAALFAPGGAPAIAPDGTLTFTPAANASGTATITVSVTDSGGTDNGGDNISQNFTFTIVVTAVNDAPTLNDPADRGATIGSLTTVNLTGIGAGGGESQGLTVTATSSNTAIVPHPSVSYTSPSAIGSLAFTPLNSGPVTITVRVTDDNGTPGDTADDAFFEQSFVVTVAANQPPVTTRPAAVSTNEDTPFAFTGGSSVTVSDPDGTPGNVTTVASVPSGRGTLSAAAGGSGATVTISNNGTTVTFVGSASAVNAALQSLVYTPPANANTTTFGGTFLLSLGTTDALGAGDATSVVVTVNPVNDAPSFTLAGGPAAVNEDSGAQTVAGFATNIAAGPATATDETGQTLTFLVTGNSNPGLFAVGGAPAIAPNGTLTYTPAANAFGTATVTVVLRDSGGGTDTSASQQFTITVNPVSDAPAGTNATVTTLEDTEYTFSAADFGFSDPNDVPSDAFAGVVVTSLPATGTLRNGGAAVTAGQFVSAADIAAGNLRYTPATNANGSASFTFQVQDTGAVGLNLDTTPNTLGVTITPVNDAPTVTLAATAVGLSQGSGPFSQANFATFNPGGGPDEAGQTPTYTVFTNNAPLFSVAPAIDAGGQLTFTLAPGASGSATFTVTVTDSGPGGAPNVNTSGQAQFDLTVFPGVTATAEPVGPGGLSVASSSQLVAFGTDAGAPGLVQVVSATTGALVRSFFPFGAFSGGLRVAVADVTGDGTDDVVVATASLVAAVAVFDGATGGLVNVYLPFGLFPAGAQVATGDLNGDGRDDLVIGLSSGAPFVVAIDGLTGGVMRVINAIPGFAGGVRVAVGDVTGDGRADIVATAGPGGNGLVAAYDGATGGLAAAFFAAPGFGGEINLAMGDVTGDGLTDLVLGIQVAGGTLVGAFTPSGQLAKGYFVPTTGAPTNPGLPPAPTPAAWLAIADANGDGVADLFVGDPAGTLVTRVLVVNGATGGVIRDRVVLDPLFGSGL